ncbi:hypothetical protein ABE325_21275 [Bacillus licheniformis]|nr:MULTISPECIES: hypothetical protein [Bacillus subtilis group]ARW46056.1 hypothetical protein S100141_04836 [Bacillus licheniformis]MCY1628326.1 hypothetical protein [Bacillus paralicheniformis]MDE1421957.1 hypothetical protein [Bacillus licheniformis]MEC0475962.1 hypothetical protein [Bacillus licheniformis]QAS18716.1 hypothetical protein EQJ69_22595 [Bacillus licheniformis]
MNLENSIKDVISKKMQDGTVEEIVEKELVNGVTNAVGNLFRSYGDLTKIIEEKVKSVMIPYLEKYDYSEYIIKLDSVLVEILKSSALENKRLLENFKELMIEEEADKTIKLSNIFESWKKQVAKEIETDDLDIDYDSDEPTYENVEVSFEVIINESPSWSSIDHATVVFECEHDEKVNAEFRIIRSKDVDGEAWTITYDHPIYNINSLRHLNEFDILLMKIRQNFTKIILDDKFGEDVVTPEAMPELSYS